MAHDIVVGNWVEQKKCFFAKWVRARLATKNAVRLQFDGCALHLPQQVIVLKIIKIRKAVSNTEHPAIRQISV